MSDIRQKSIRVKRGEKGANLKDLTNSNYLWRIYFTFMVMLSHCRFIDTSTASWYIAVDYFFMISGLMIAYRIDKKGNDASTFSFILGRIKNYIRIFGFHT